MKLGWGVLMIKYKSYGKLPKEFYGVEGSFFNKPRGGLWGCRGEEWRDWCLCEQFEVKKLKHYFYFKLKKNSKVYRIRTKKDFINLCEKYPNYSENTIDFIEMAKDYDAVEVVGDIVYKLRFGVEENKLGFDMAGHGLYAWDVPSICVLNPEKAEIIKGK